MWSIWGMEVGPPWVEGSVEVQGDSGAEYQVCPKAPIFWEPDLSYSFERSQSSHFSAPLIRENIKEREKTRGEEGRGEREGALLLPLFFSFSFHPLPVQVPFTHGSHPLPHQNQLAKGLYHFLFLFLKKFFIYPKDTNVGLYHFQRLFLQEEGRLMTSVFPHGENPTTA